jgi:hypothetical protein
MTAVRAAGPGSRLRNRQDSVPNMTVVIHPWPILRLNLNSTSVSLRAENRLCHPHLPGIEGTGRRRT